MKKSFIVKVYAVVLPALLISTSPLQPVEATNKKITVEKEKLEIAKNLILANIELNIIKKATGLSLREIKNIKVE